MSIYTGRNKKNTIYWIVRYRDSEGKIRQKYSQNKDWTKKAHAEADAAEFLKTVTNADHDITMDELFDLYISDSEKRNKPSTRISYVNLYNSKIKPYFGTTPVNRITPRVS